MAAPLIDAVIRTAPVEGCVEQSRQIIRHHSNYLSPRTSFTNKQLLRGSVPVRKQTFSISDGGSTALSRPAGRRSVAQNAGNRRSCALKFQ